MSIILLYLLKSTICMSVLYLVFRTLMRKQTFFQLNRLILLSIVGISIIIPLVHLPQTIQPSISFRLAPVADKIEVYDLNFLAETAKTGTEVAGQPAESPSPHFALAWPKLLQIIYLSGLLVALLASLTGFLNILLLFRKVTVINKDGFRLLITNDDIPAFSLGRYLFISKSDFETNGDTILTHEKSHIRLGHFYDLLLLEAVKIIYWFNPVIYWLKRDLKAVHEFQADDSTLNNGIDATQYQLLIIQKCVGHQKFALANSFNHCQIKNRIVMMNKQKSKKVWRWTAAAFIPMLAFLLMAFGKTGENVPPERFISITLEKALQQKSVGPISGIDNVVSFNSTVVSQGKRIPPPPPPPFNIEIKKEGIFVFDKLYSMEELIENAKLYQKNYPGKDILLLVDNPISHNRVEEIREALENAGVFHVKQSTLNKNVTKAATLVKPENISINKDTQESKSGTVNGKVILSDGRPLQRILVRVKGTNGIFTDKDGRFKLEDVPKDGVLEFQNVGLNTSIVKPDFENTMIIKMEPGSFWIDRVKVVGHVSDNTPPATLPKISFASHMTINPPLFIVDGVIADKSKMDQVEPDDVASVKVLKGKSATDKYGPMAKNGVMEIKTKKKVSLPTENSKVNVEMDEYAVNQKMDIHSNNVIEEMPEFVGGMKDLMRYIAVNIKYPDRAETDKVQGSVEVNFVINQNGKVVNAKVTKEIHPALDAEAIRVISSMPDWNPGKQDGKTVDVSFTIPIQFSLK